MTCWSCGLGQTPPPPPPPPPPGNGGGGGTPPPPPTPPPTEPGVVARACVEIQADVDELLAYQADTQAEIARVQATIDEAERQYSYLPLDQQGDEGTVGFSIRMGEAGSKAYLGSLYSSARMQREHLDELNAELDAAGCRKGSKMLLLVGGAAVLLIGGYLILR